MLRHALLTLGALGALAAPALLGAQDTTQRGVRIGLTYQMGTRPGVMVLAPNERGAAADSLQAILQRDLDYGDRVTIVGAEVANAAGAVKVSGTGRLNFALLAKLGAAAAVQPTLTASGVHVALYDVGQEKVAQVGDFPLPATVGSHEWRMAVHRAADEVERWITGVAGIAATRIAFVRDGRIHAVDSDGAFDAPVPGVGAGLSPAWDPTGRYLAYAVMSDAGTRIAVTDLVTRRTRVVASGGLNVTPTFSPDGHVIVYTHGEDEGTDLYAVAPFTGGPSRRVTVGRGTDNVSPSFSPDGQRIAFTSGRSGHPEVYITDADGTNAELLTPYAFGDQYYRSNPDWSPDGRQVVFQSQIAGEFQVMTIALRDRSVKQLTSEGRNEDPSWAPDGRHVVFTSNRTGVKQLFVLDTESGRIRQLTHDGGARLGAWSRRLGQAP